MTDRRTINGLNLDSEAVQMYGLEAIVGGGTDHLHAIDPDPPRPPAWWRFRARRRWRRTVRMWAG